MSSTHRGKGLSASVLTLGPISCLDAHEFRDEYLSAKADQDAEALRGKSCKPILEANTRQRDAPPGAFWFWLLLGHLARTHYLSDRTRTEIKDRRCLKHFRSTQEAWRAIGPTGITMNPRRSRAAG